MAVHELLSVSLACVPVGTSTPPLTSSPPHLPPQRRAELPVPPSLPLRLPLCLRYGQRTQAGAGAVVSLQGKVTPGEGRRGRRAQNSLARVTRGAVRRGGWTCVTPVNGRVCHTDESTVPYKRGAARRSERHLELTARTLFFMSCASVCVFVYVCVRVRPVALRTLSYVSRDLSSKKERIAWTSLTGCCARV